MKKKVESDKVPKLDPIYVKKTTLNYDLTILFLGIGIIIMLGIIMFVR